MVMSQEVASPLGQNLERTVRNAAEYLTELDCLQQMLELECQKIDQMLADIEAKEKFIISLTQLDTQYKYCMLYMAKAYADTALYIEQQYLSESNQTCSESHQIGALFVGIYQVSLEVAFVYMHAVQPSNRPAKQHKLALLSWSEAQQKRVLPLLWRLCSDPYETFVRAHSGAEQPVPLSRRMSSLCLVGRVSDDGPAPETCHMPAVFVSFIHQHIARFAPYFLKRQQRLVTGCSTHLPPHKYLRKALALLLESAQEAFRQELCTGEFHQKFLHGCNAGTDDGYGGVGARNDVTQLTERYRRPASAVQQFLTECGATVDKQLDVLHKKFLTQCACGRLFHVFVE